jgi:hypothetical protein
MSERVNAPERIEVWWCPRCEVVSKQRWHFCEKGAPLIPQTDIETECVPVTYVREGNDG